MENKRKYVIPGDLITTGPFRPEQNVVLEGNKIISTSIGMSSVAPAIAGADPSTMATEVCELISDGLPGAGFTPEEIEDILDIIPQC